MQATNAPRTSCRAPPRDVVDARGQRPRPDGGASWSTGEAGGRQLGVSCPGERIVEVGTGYRWWPPTGVPGEEAP